MSIAIVSGASGGLGSAFVDTIIAEYPEISEIWAIARKEDKLKRLEEAYPAKKFRLIPCDLSKQETYTEIERLLDEVKPEIEFLICNCGGFVRGDFQEVPLQKHIGLVNLNIIGTLSLTHICLPYMKRGGCIVEVGSTSSFAIEPRVVTYCSTKAFVKFFAAGLRYELKYRDGRGINVIAVHPGYMDTEMNAELPAASSVPRTDAHKLASNGLKAARKGRYSYTLGAFYHLMYAAGRVLPDNAAAFVMDRGHDLTYKMDKWKENLSRLIPKNSVQPDN